MFSGSRVGWLNEIAVQTTLLGAMKLQVTVGGKEGINIRIALSVLPSYFCRCFLSVSSI